MTSNVQSMWRTLAVMFVIAVALNYIWELAQSPLFVAASHGRSVWLHCFIASLGDGVMVLLLFGLGWLRFGNRYWFERAGAREYAALVTAGASLAVVVEWVAVHLLQRWTYSEAMPRLPSVNVGVIPVLQMMLLPPLIFYLTVVFRRRPQFDKN